MFAVYLSQVPWPWRNYIGDNCDSPFKTQMKGPACRVRLSEGRVCQVRSEGRACRVRSRKFDYPFCLGGHDERALSIDFLYRRSDERFVR